MRGMGLFTREGHTHEASNYALKDMRKHNLNTWKMNEWIGVGPSASSQYQNKGGRIHQPG